MDPRNSENVEIFGKSPVNWLLEICAKDGISPNFETRDMRTDITAEPEFEVKCSIENFKGDYLMVYECARTKKMAKHRASILMLNLMKITKADLLKMNSLGKKGFSSILANNNTQPQGGQIVNTIIPSPEINAIDMSHNYVSSLMEFCSKKSLIRPTFKVLAKTGPDHMPEFTMSLTTGFIGQSDFYVLQESKCANQMVIKQILAARMLDKLRCDVDNLNVNVIRGTESLEKEEKSVISHLTKLEIADRPSCPCSLQKCAELFGHTHHYLQKNLKGATVTALKAMVKEDILLEAKCLDILNGLCDEQKKRGFKVGIHFTLLGKAPNLIRCFSNFKFQDIPYAHFGTGVCEISAKNAASKKALEFLAEIASNT